MKPKDAPITFPLSALGILAGFLSGICLISGGVILWGSLEILVSSLLAFLVYLPYVVLGLALLIGGAVGLLNSFLTVRLDPDSIALTALGRTVRRYPLEQLRTFALVQRGLAKSQTTHLCVSTKSVEELAELRAARIRADDRTRRLAAQRRRTTWQEAFAGDYLRKRAHTALFTRPGRDLFWLGCNLENIGLLRLAYPQVPWLILPEAQSSPMRYSGDSDPTTAVFPNTKQTIVFDEAGAAVVKKGNRTELFTADQIRTIVCTEQLFGGGGYYEKYLLLTTRTPEELIGEFKRRDLDTLRRLKGWQLLALHHACDARMPRFDPRGVGKDLVSVPWYAAREQTLRQLYPQAAYFDCSNEALFHAVFDQE